LIRGEIAVNGKKITSGDAILLEQESQIQITDANKGGSIGFLIFGLVCIIAI